MVSSSLGLFSVVLTILSFEESMSIEGLLFAIPMTILDAMFPILIWTACYDRSQNPATQDLLSDTRAAKRHLGAWHDLRLQEASYKFWSTLRHITFLSVFILVPIFLLCGEPQDIRRNSYVLDVPFIWILLMASGWVNAAVILLPSLLVKTTSSLTPTFLTVPSNAIVLVVFGGSLAAYGWTSIGLCWFFSFCFILSQLSVQPKETLPTTTIQLRHAYVLLRSIALGAVVWGSLYGINRLHQASSRHTSSRSTCEHHYDPFPNATISGVPKVSSATKDDYLGPRPSVNTMANISMIIEACHEIPGGGGVDDVVNCLTYLTEKENEYFTLSVSSSSQIGQSFSQNSGIIHGEPSTSNRPASSNAPSAESASATSVGTCLGDVIPFHVYWTGPATWRFELFVKAYLYTQNLPCSRLWIWLDEDIHPGAVNNMLCNDPIFQRFLPLVKRGDIVLKSWTLPSRIPLPKETIDNSSGLYFSPRPSERPDEAYIANEIVQDTDNNYWLALNPTSGAFTPVQISDAVRFIVLHLHGGVYFDVDVLMLRDMRPMLLPDPVTGVSRAFAEQWVERFPPSDYNTAVISLPANSTLSTYLLRGGVRMGMNFHPLVIGRMMLKDGRNDEVAMLHNAVFDPLVTNLRRMGTETCTVPCHKNFKSVFMRVVEEPEKEWSNFYGEQGGDVVGTWPVTNRSLANFFRGAWAYHIHNQVYHPPHLILQQLSRGSKC